MKDKIHQDSNNVQGMPGLPLKDPLNDGRRRDPFEFLGWEGDEKQREVSLTANLVEQVLDPFVKRIWAIVQLLKDIVIGGLIIGKAIMPLDTAPIELLMVPCIVLKTNA